MAYCSEVGGLMVEVEFVIVWLLLEYEVELIVIFGEVVEIVLLVGAEVVDDVMVWGMFNDCVYFC